MRQGRTSSYVTTSRPDTASQSGLLEQLMSQDNGLQVILLDWDMHIDVVLEDGESLSAGKCCSCQCCVYAQYAVSSMYPTCGIILHMTTVLYLA